MYTLSNLRDLVFKYMDEYSNDGTVISDGDNADYLKKFYSFANKVNIEVAGLIKIPGNHVIFQVPLVNQLTSQYITEIYDPADGDNIWETSDKVNSIYLELYGKGTVNIYGNSSGEWLIQNTTIGTSDSGVVQIRHQMADSENAKIVITGDYPALIKNIAAYTGKYTLIPKWSPYRRYEMPSDFMKLDKISQDNFKIYYSQGWRWEDNTTLIIQSDFNGVYELQYWAYPAEITDTTSLSATFEQPDRVVAVMAYKIASLILTSSNEKPMIYTRLMELYETELSRIIESNAVETNYIQDVYNLW